MKRRWVREEAGDYEYREGDRVLARVYREGHVWRWVLEDVPRNRGLDSRDARTVLANLAETAKVTVEAVISGREGI